ncbi:MAG: dihydrolipoamide acetyltransferase family protein [Flavobacteriales bacterium]|nr:dihydrolipoamide acetyltransferase family protein [Flavobacteriales bacterium]
MAEIDRMPKLSDTMTEGTVAKWHKKIGDKVKVGELLAEIETDKATMDYESPYNGMLLHIGIESGKTARVNALLAIIGIEGEDISAILENETKVSENVSAPIALPVAEASIPAPQPVAAPIAAKAPAAPVAKIQSTNGRTKASPLAKKMAEEKGMNITRIAGSGDGGRIVKRDVENFAPGFSSASRSQVENFHEEQVSQMRKTIARRLAESKFTAPHFYLTMEIDMDNAVSARNAILEQAGSKISFNDMVIKAAAVALHKHPKVNSSWLGDVIRFNDHVHIGVAIAVEEGLLVPVVRFADTKSFVEINSEVKTLAEKAKTKKLQPQDWEGNTFTISNLGMFGIEEFTAIINPPDSCILAVGAIKQTPVVKNGIVVPGNVMKVTLSCDHRAVDGATGAAFLQTLKANLENPVLMFV